MAGKRPLWVPLAGGIQTDIADDLLPLGRSLEITNMQFAETGKLVKRAGNTVLPAPSVQMWQLAKYKGARTLLGSSITQPISVYSPTKAAWMTYSTGKTGPLVASMNRLATKGASAPPLIASGAGYYYVAYREDAPSTAVRLDVVDAVTLQTVNSQTFAFNLYDIVFCNGFAVLVTVEFGVGVHFFTMTPSTFAVSTTNFADAGTGGMCAAMVKNATTISVAYASGGNAAAVDFVPSTLVTTGWGPRSSAGAVIPVDLTLAWMNDLSASGKQALITASNAVGVRVQWDIPAAGVTRNATTTYNADPSAFPNGISQLTGHTIGAGATGDFQVLISTQATAGVNSTNFTKMAIRTGGVLTAGFVLFRSVSVSAKAFLAGGDFFASFVFSEETDANSYLLKIPIVTSQPTTAPPQAIFGVGTTGNLILGFVGGGYGLAQTIAIGSGTFATVAFFQGRVGGRADVTYDESTAGVSLVKFSFIDQYASSATGAPIELFDSLLVPGGTIGQFDGAAFAELGFPYQPPATATFTAGAGGALTPSSTYWYCFVFAFEDAQGRWWRSAPSVPQSVTLGGAQNAVTINAPTLRVTSRTNVRIEIYRGAANDSTLFQLATVAVNSLAADTVGVNDFASDSDLARGEVLYTSGDTPQTSPLPNTTIPGALFLFSFQNRLCFISADDPTELWFSNRITPKNGVRFNTQNVVRIADERGGLYGAAAMDDKVVAFKADATYAFSGEGPDDAGNGSFSPPQITTLGIGCNEPRSIVADKDGVFFNSTSPRPGIQKIGRDLSLGKDANGMSFGAAVMRYSGETIVSSVLVPEQSQIRFYCLTGRVLVYDLNAQLWSTFLLTLPEGDNVVTAVAVGGGVTFASDGGNVYTEDTTGVIYGDNGNIYPVIVSSPWIQGSGTKGFQRVSEMIGTGKTVGDHTLTVNMYTDLNDSTIVNTKNWALTVAANPRWNWEWIPRTQRMSATRIVVSEQSLTAGFECEGITAYVGAKPGMARQPTTTRGP